MSLLVARGLDPAMNNVEHDAIKELPFLDEFRSLEDGIRFGKVGVWRWKIDTDQLEWTRNLESVHGVCPGSYDGTLQSFQRDIHPDDADTVWQKIKACIDASTPYKATYRTMPRPNHPELWIEASGGISSGTDGYRYLTGVCLDVTERAKNEAELRRRLGQQSAVARFGSFALSQNDLQKVLDRAVEVAADVLDVPLTKILQFSDAADRLVLRAGIGWEEGLVGYAEVGTEMASQAGYTLSVNEPVIVWDLPLETRFDGPKLLNDHEVRSGLSVVISGSEARPFGVFGIHSRDLRSFDPTDAEFLQSLANIVTGAARHAAATDRQQLLLREMAHRAGNMLQLVNSIAGQTFNDGADIKPAKKVFSERLSALSRSNYAVSRGGWTATRFAELIEDILEPFRHQVVTEGRDIMLSPELCFDMGLILHELATNSAKYGTLGKDEGTITVKWSFQNRAAGQQMFCLDWDDPISQYEVQAKGTGFGSKLVNALIERKWNGSVVVEQDAYFRISLEVPVGS